VTIEFDVLIVGAGISGIGAAIELRKRGRYSFLIVEADAELGGTWRDNTYPGVAVDIPCISYSYSFETDYPWTRLYAPGAEILAYVRHCAEKYGIRPHIRFGARVASCRFDAASNTWSARLHDGSIVTSRFVISATGLLNQPRRVEIPGLEAYEGKLMHTARWDHGHDLAAKRVAVIGTGASAVQVVPEIAPRVAHLSVFQRTPIWVGPRMDAPIPRRGVRHWSVARWVRRQFSEAGLEFLTFSIVNYRRFPLVVRLVQRLVARWMRGQVRDRATLAQLTPAYGLGCKRPAPSNDYLRAFNRDNVRLVTQPIHRVCPDGIVTSDQELHRVDTIVLATGFLTTEKGNGPSFEVFNGDGVELGQFWDEQRLQAYAGVSVPGFPNFFLTAGPYSGGFNWFAALESHLGQIMRCLDEARARSAKCVEVRRDAHERYMRYMWFRADGTVFKDASCATARSYYLDRHGDASLPLPQTPWWRAVRSRWRGTQDYEFSATERGAA
jgi:cation diffusion facilitator CzcD-associated flavoprotein CzcO